MEKNIILEINRNLELMKVKPLVIESTTDPINDILQNLYTKIKTSLERYKTIKIPDYKNLQTIKDIFTNFLIPYDTKLNAIVEILSKYNNNLNDPLVVKILFADILDKIKQKFPNNVNSIIDESINKPYSTTINEINDIIKNIFKNEGYELINISPTELDMLRYFIYVFNKNNSYQSITRHIPTKDFFEWFVKEASEKAKEVLNLKGKNADVLFKENPNLIDTIVNSKDISDDFKYLSLKKYLGLDNNQISAFTNLIIKLAKDEEFIKKLKNYYSDTNKFDELLEYIWEGEKIETHGVLYKKLKNFLLNLDDIQKTNILFLKLKFFIDTGYAGDIVKKFKPSNFNKFFLKNIPLYSKYNLATRLIYNNLVKRHNLLNTQMASILIEYTNKVMDPKANKQKLMEEYRATAQKFFIGYYVQTGQDIGMHMVEPLIELKKAIGKDSNPDFINQVTELITTFKEIPENISGSFKNINIYLKFYAELTEKAGQKTNNNNIRELLATAFNPFGEKWNTYFNQRIKTYFSDETILKKSLNIITKAAHHSLAQAWFWGAPINLKLVVTCIKIYSKKLQASPTLKAKAGLIVSLYITYTIANIFYRLSLLIFFPLMQTAVNFIGVGFDKLLNPIFNKLNIESEGFISRRSEEKYGVNSSGSGPGAAGRIFINILLSKYGEYFKNMIGITLEEQTNKSFSKILGENWQNILLDPALTNFENGQFFKSYVQVYNITNNKDLQTFKQVLWDGLSGIAKELINSLKNNPELNEINTTSTTNQIINKTYIYDSMYNKTFVPYFTYENIKSIKLNNIDISRNVIKNQRGGIIIKDVQRNDVENIVITSKYNNNIYKLKN